MKPCQCGTHCMLWWLVGVMEVSLRSGNTCVVAILALESWIELAPVSIRDFPWWNGPLCPTAEDYYFELVQIETDLLDFLVLSECKSHGFLHSPESQVQRSTGLLSLISYTQQDTVFQVKQPPCPWATHPRLSDCKLNLLCLNLPILSWINFHFLCLVVAPILSKCLTNHCRISPWVKELFK